MNLEDILVSKRNSHTGCMLYDSVHMNYPEQAELRNRAGQETKSDCLKDNGVSFEGKENVLELGHANGYTTLGIH